MEHFKQEEQEATLPSSTADFTNATTLLFPLKHLERVMVDPRLPCLREHFILSWVCWWSLGMAAWSSSLVVEAGTTHSDSFPPRHEYDFEVLDPYNMFGSPRGGFSRATLSRLAVLPLQLPPVPVVETGNGGEDNVEDPTSVYYTTVRDANGRQFACRLYHEDELDPSSLDDSMFDAPKIRTRSTSSLPDEEADRVQQEQEAVATGGAPSSEGTSEDGASDGSATTFRTRPTTPSPHHDETAASKQHPEGIATSGDPTTRRPREDNLLGTGGDSPGSVTINADGSMQLQEKTSSNPLHEDYTEINTSIESENRKVGKRKELTVSEKDVEDRLIALDGFCAHIHLGWWSTEWCYKTSVNQFHVTVDQSVPEHHTLQITDLTKLGTFERRRIESDLGPEKPLNPLAGDLPEVARVLDIHTEGDVCDATGQPRSTLVQLLCCSPKLLEKSKPDVSSSDVNPPVAALYGVFEDPDKVCNYVVTVCTNLLCGGDERQLLPGIASVKQKDMPPKVKLPPKEKESVREILDRAIGDRCLESSTGGWWSYSYCHGEKVTQFHEVLEARKTSAGAHYSTRSIEAEHLLGRYHAELDEIHSFHDDWKHVVNATGKSRGGPGSYFPLEYTGGDVCDHSDVTDAAIIAGGIGAGLVARSSTIRFFCGSNYMVSVSEDSTCHYLVDVTVPELCSHPLFKEPVMMKQVMKCLPVVEKNEAETDDPREDSDVEEEEDSAGNSGEG